jgi:hypothetical protein
MSWSVFHARCSVLTGLQHVSKEQFSNTIANAYHQTVLLHFDTMTAGGVVVNSAPKVLPMYQTILAICNANLLSNADVNWIQQIGPAFQTYWAGNIIVGPTGTATVLSPGSWIGPKIIQNLNFSIMLNTLMATARTHIMTLTGTYVSSVVPGVVSPWSGAMLQTLP